MLNFGQNEVLGLDIGSSSVKIIQLRTNGENRTVSKAGIIDICSSAEDSNHNEAETVKAIRNCFRTSGARTRLAVCSVCGSEVAVRDFSFPDLLPDEVASAVMLEASQVCPFNVDDGAVDYQVIDKDSNQLTGVLVAATNKLVRTKTHLASSASLKNVLMDVDGLALLNCLEQCEDPDIVKTTAVLNVGNNYTTLAVVGRDSVPFVRDMTFAGNDIINRLAELNDVSPDQIRHLLSEEEGSSEAGFDIQSSLASACEKIITDVTSTLRYYTAQGKTEFIEKVLVCGGFALVKGFVELLDNHLPAKVELWNPFDRIQCDDAGCKDILKEKGPAMAVAAGLAMRGI
jgi:type IV pilus assembly protein PilM